MARALGGESYVVSAYGELEAERLWQGSEEYFFSTEEDTRARLDEAARPLVQAFPERSRST